MLQWNIPWINSKCSQYCLYKYIIDNSSVYFHQMNVVSLQLFYEQAISFLKESKNELILSTRKIWRNNFCHISFSCFPIALLSVWKLLVPGDLHQVTHDWDPMNWTEHRHIQQFPLNHRFLEECFDLMWKTNTSLPNSQYFL